MDVDKMKLFRKNYPEWEEIDRRMLGKKFLILDMELNHPLLMIDLIRPVGGSIGSYSSAIIKYSTNPLENPEQNPSALEIITAFNGIRSEEDLQMLASATWEKNCNGSDTSHLEIALYKINNSKR